jgi:hypothetical protein
MKLFTTSVIIIKIFRGIHTGEGKKDSMVLRCHSTPAWFKIETLSGKSTNHYAS